MKTKILFETLLLSLSLFCITSCSDDAKNDEMKIPENIDNAFSNKYSSAQPRTWSRYGNYYIATFTDAGNFNETAWFDSNGIWQMSKTDLPKTQILPSAVEYAFSNSEYADQEITAITRIERLMMEGILYRISVAKGEVKQDIYIQENGTLLRSLYGNQNQFWLIEVPQEINQYMTDNYKGIPILGILLNDNGKIESICQGIGVDPQHIRVLNPVPKNHEELCRIIREEIEYKGVSVIIPRRICIQKARREGKKQK